MEARESMTALIFIITQYLPPMPWYFWCIFSFLAVGEAFSWFNAIREHYGKNGSEK
jgi:hypothetical protein